MHHPADILERNLQALAPGSPRAVAAIRAAAPAANLEFITTPDGALTARRILAPGRATHLASPRRPLEEAARIAGLIDVRATPGVVALGFGLGHHVATVARALARTGILLCFEPDIPLLRAVLERVDHGDWIRRANLVLITHADDSAPISEAISGAEGLFTLGAAFLEHPACRARLGNTLDAFATRFTDVLRAARTTILTTLVQSEATLRNLLMNADWYVSSRGISDLRDAARARPAVVVSAGPSLQRNLHLLAQPGIRDRVVIIAVQTVLKTLLAKGIRPHFVTALDHHEISRRFYEGLSAADVEGVTLVAEPRANPAILDAFPGAIRCVHDDWLEDILRDVAPPKGSLPAGATVAHLAYSLARHLGCDPVIMIGQDLGFTDNHYYAANAAIHTTWSSELNPFRSLEMLEWERIARSRRLLRRLNDLHDRPIYTDEQMATYLVQFERMFAADAQRGLTTIDATEGGVRKRSTTPMTLADALGCTTAAAPSSPIDLPPAPRSRDTRRIDLAHERLTRARHESHAILRLSREARDLLEKVIAAYPDERRANDLVRRIEPISRQVARNPLGLQLTQHLNQVGTLNRFRADRSLAMEHGLTPVERQRRQAERDLENVTRLADAAERIGSLLDRALASLRGSPKATRDEPPHAAITTTTRAHAVAIIPVHPDLSSLGTRRRLADPVAGGRNALELTLMRLARTQRIRTALLLTPEPDRLRALLPDPAALAPLSVRIVPIDPDAMRDRQAAVAAARLFSPDSWRGGIAGLTVYDELLLPRHTARALAEHAPEADAALLLGPDWCAVDAPSCDALIARHEEHPAGSRVTFTQAAPGLTPVLLARSIIDEFAASQDRSAHLATIGASLAYLPVSPQSDPIAKPCCLPVDPAWRDLGARAILDLPLARAALLPALASLGDAAPDTPTDELVHMLAERAALAPAAPQHITLELCTGRLTSGLRADWLHGRDDAPERAPIAPERAIDIARQILEINHAAAITLAGAGDPVRHPALLDIIRGIRALGAHALHLRSDLLVEPRDADTIARAGLSVISADLMAHTRPTYRSIMGLDLLERATNATVAAIDAARSLRNSGGLSSLWIVPRITRCDTALHEIEPFYDHWLTNAGSCAIDPLPRRAPRERLEPLPLPLPALTRLARTELTILCDARVMPDHPSTHNATLPHASTRLPIGIVGGRSIRDGSTIADLHRALWRVRRQSLPTPAPTTRTLLAA